MNPPVEGSVESPKKSSCKEDYEIIGDSIGKGAYGKVHLVKRDESLFAMKEI